MTSGARRAWRSIALGVSVLLVPVCVHAQPAPSAPATAKAAPEADAAAQARLLDTWGDRAGALKLLAARVTAAPSDVEARALYGTMLMWDAKNDEARVELAAVLQADPKHSEARRSLIQVEQQSKHPERARDLATEGLKREPNRIDLLLERGRASLILGRLAEARADLDHLLELDPHHKGARELRERLRSALKMQEILASAGAMSQEDPGFGTLAALLAVVPVGVAFLAYQAAEPARVSHGAVKTDLIANARALSSRGDRARSLQLLKWHLDATPGDTDARTLYGTVLSWEGRYDEAREQLAIVLKAKPGHYDAVRAAIHAELWADKPNLAEALATKALEKEKDSTELLLDRAKARLAQGDKDGARADVDRVLHLEPTNPAALKLLKGVESAERVWTFGASYALSAFSDGRTAWHENTYSAKRVTELGSVILRRYLASRFGTFDHQYEVELFPKIRPGTYADVGAAFSPLADLYPNYRLQADIYQSLPFGLETSIGYRHLEFGSGVDIGVLTVSKYFGDWFFTVRAFITPGIAGTSVSVSGSVRRYFLDGLAHLGLRYSHGLAKEELRSVNDIVLLSSNGLGTEASWVITDRVDVGLRASASQETRASRSDLWQYDLTTSVGVRF